ncbi:MAG TPA: ABC transporter ATP-binding protein [Gaiellaceae bacterium]|nr:ABC transporter ATP-binding protein [Gaiellaceae bacterium]
MARGEIQLIELSKQFGELTAVDRIELSVRGGEFFSLLGPSGCGKTTTLRMIAGFEQPTSGQILLDERDVAYTPPHKRNVNTVFQNYALFPHLNVFDNVAFGLRRAKRPKGEVRERVARALELVQLAGYERRKSSQLSGGQQQRIALARALVLNPAVLLLDEPLGALDAKLRKTLQIELKALQQEVGITFLYVTHDQEEALTMSDRLAVMNAGRVEQVGAPQNVYEEPETIFVADFLGVSNLMDATAQGAHDGHCRVAVEQYEFEAHAGESNLRGPAKIVIRPERIELEPHGSPAGPNRLPGMVERLVYVGSAVQVIVRAATGEALQALVQNTGKGLPYEQGTPVQVHLPAEALRVLPAAEPPQDEASGEE